MFITILDYLARHGLEMYGLFIMGFIVSWMLLGATLPLHSKQYVLFCFMLSALAGNGAGLLVVGIAASFGVTRISTFFLSVAVCVLVAYLCYRRLSGIRRTRKRKTRVHTSR